MKLLFLIYRLNQYLGNTEKSILCTKEMSYETKSVKTKFDQKYINDVTQNETQMVFTSYSLEYLFKFLSF